MKIYFAVNLNDLLNPFVDVLIKRIKENDSQIEIASGIDFFWEDDIFSCNIIHVQWPDLLIKGTKKNPVDLKKRIDKIKANGSKIVTTCHNITAHYAKYPWQNEAYSIVYEASDLILHMGHYSLALFKEKYPNVQHEILFHHIYDDRYNIIYSKHEAAKKLKLSSRYRYILCLGAFRNLEERKMILELKDYLKKNSIKILAPSFFISPKPLGIRSTLKYCKNRLQTFFLNHYFNIINFSKNIADEEIPIFFAMADVVLLQRITILNSGNIPLGFYFNKVVIGPNTGNVFEILKQTSNPIFDVNKLQDLPHLIDSAIELSQHGLGERNGLFAKENFSSVKIAQELLKYYKKLF